MKKIISTLSVFAFVVAFCLNANAQLANTYTFSTTTGVALEDMTGATVLQTAPNDDDPSALTTFPGGFAFVYEGVSYTQFSTTPDGFCKLGSPAAVAQFTNAIASTTNRPKVFAMWDDLALGTLAGGGNVSYKIFGSSPNRKVVVQWFVTIPRNTTGAANSTFQVWFNESTCGSGVVSFVYGTMGNAPSSSVGINSVAANATNFQSVTVSTNTNSIVTANNANAVSPASGRQYTYTPPAPTEAMSVTASNLLDGRIFSEGKCYSFTATVTKSGPTSVSGVPVIYAVDGIDMGSVNTGTLGCNGTEVESFLNALCNLSAGAHAISIRTNASLPVVNGAPLVVNITVLAKITTLPYIQNFTTADGMTILLTNPVGTTGIWSLATAVNPDGVAADFAGKANFFSASLGRVEILRTREFDFTGIANPVLNFYVAYKSYIPSVDDRLEVLVSTDNGLTFFPASTTYNKTRSTTPELSTLVSATASFTPSNEIQWRHETVNMSNVGNISNVVIGFRATSAFGNNCWIDNVIVSTPNALCTDNVTGPGAYNCNPSVSLNFTATPVPHSNVGNNIDNASISGKQVIKSEEYISNIPTVNGDATVTSGIQLDNAAGGTAFISTYLNNDPGQAINPNVGGTLATSNDGLVHDPAFIYSDIWFTTTYNGNDSSGYATYNISIDYGSLFFTLPNELYIVKRTDRTGKWTCLNTTRVGTVLTTTGLTDFCDFGIAGTDVQPVELSSFVSSVNGRNIELNWSTSTEANNSGFDIERSSVSGSWTKVGNVAGNGTTSTGHSYSYTDRNVATGNYSYRLKQIDFNGNFEYFNLSNEVIIGIPTKFDLSQNYPNPFNPSTKISYDLPVDGRVSLKIFDMSGKELMTLVNEVKTAGYYSVSFNASSLSSGVYFYSLSADNFTATKKMMLIK